MLAAHEKEIHKLHAFFEAWYRGSLDNSDHSFSRLKDVLAPEFTLITSDGYTVPREMLLDLMRAERGSKPEIEMRVEVVQLKLTSGEIVLATYQEHGTTANGSKATLSTAVLRTCSGCPNGLEWVHIHEVRLSQ